MRKDKQKQRASQIFSPKTHKTKIILGEALDITILYCNITKQEDEETAKQEDEETAKREDEETAKRVIE